MYSIQNEAATYVKCGNILHYDKIQDRPSIPTQNVPSYRRGGSSRDVKGVWEMELCVIFVCNREALKIQRQETL